MSSEPTLVTRGDYREWLGQLKTRFGQVQLKAAVAVNSALLQFYWELGADIVAKQGSSQKTEFKAKPVGCSVAS